MTPPRSMSAGSTTGHIGRPRAKSIIGDIAGAQN